MSSSEQKRLKPKRWTTLHKVWLLVAFLPVLILAGFTAWASDASGPMPEARAALRADDQVLVEQKDWAVFRPASQEVVTGLIFYPGGRVHPDSYAPLARAIAAEGYLVVVPPMPLNLAVFSPNLASQVIEAHPEIRQWAVGGHSLGGAMAATFVSAHLTQTNEDSRVQGLVLLAAYPAANNDLSSMDIEVASIYGSRDNIATRERILASGSLLPPGTDWVEITGGNHAQFGWYGPQAGDNPAEISRDEQQRQVVEATVRLLARLGKTQP